MGRNDNITLEHSRANVEQMGAYANSFSKIT